MKIESLKPVKPPRRKKKHLKNGNQMFKINNHLPLHLKSTAPNLLNKIAGILITMDNE